MHKFLPLFSSLIFCAGVSAAAGAAPDLSPVARVELPRYMGRWYVIAHVPNFLEKNKVAMSDNYALRPDGKLDDVFAFRKGALDGPVKQWKGVGRVVDEASHAEWKIRFFWPLAASYRILELDPDYRWAAASTDSGRLFWILSRTPKLPEGIYQEILLRLTQRNLDISKLEKVPQRGSLMPRASISSSYPAGKG